MAGGGWLLGLPHYPYVPYVPCWVYSGKHLCLIAGPCTCPTVTHKKDHLPQKSESNAINMVGSFQLPSKHQLLSHMGKLTQTSLNIKHIWNHHCYIFHSIPILAGWIWFNTHSLLYTLSPWASPMCIVIRHMLNPTELSMISYFWWLPFSNQTWQSKIPQNRVFNGKNAINGGCSMSFFPIRLDGKFHSNTMRSSDPMKNHQFLAKWCSNHFFLVGGIPTPLKNMTVSWDDEIPNN